MQRQNSDQLANTLNSLAHKRRVVIFRTLQDDTDAGRSFAHLAVATGFCDSSLSHHLRILERTGLIERRKKGAISEYHLNTGAFQHNIQALLAECIELQTRPSGEAKRNDPRLSSLR